MSPYFQATVVTPAAFTTSHNGNARPKLKSRVIGSNCLHRRFTHGWPDPLRPTRVQTDRSRLSFCHKSVNDPHSGRLSSEDLELTIESVPCVEEWCVPALFIKG